MLFAKWIVVVFSVSAFSVAGQAATKLAPGSTALIRPGDSVPEAPEGMLWMVRSHIQNIHMRIPGAPPPLQGPILEVVLTRVQDQQDQLDKDPGVFKSTRVGGLLPPSMRLIQWRLASHGGLEEYTKYIGVATDRFVVGQTIQYEKDPDDLPELPEGYTWREEDRIAGAGTLIPDLDGSGWFTSAEDTVKYVLQKTDASLPDQLKVHRAFSAFAKSGEDFDKMLACQKPFTK